MHVVLKAIRLFSWFLVVSINGMMVTVKVALTSISAEGRAHRLGPRQFMSAGKTRDQGEIKAKRAWDARDKCPVLGSSGSDQEPTPFGYQGTLLCASDVPRHTVQ